MTYEEATEVGEEIIVFYDLVDTEEEAMEILLEATEKQIPKKVGKLDIVSYGSPYYCPECEAELIPVEFFKADGSEPEEKVSYCWKCGRAIDWSSEDGR